nr:MAG TPA: hypothetical protein [Caudoviricetes sp.]
MLHACLQRCSASAGCFCFFKKVQKNLKKLLTSTA